MLALNGEVGELQEIFQWKGDFKTPLTNKDDLFNEKEFINIGEEISDVFIYTTRLADMCCIDLAKSVKLYLNSNDPIDINKFDYLQATSSESWTHLSFGELKQLTEKHLSEDSSLSVNELLSSKQTANDAQNLLSTKKSLLLINNSPRRLCFAVQQSAAKASSLFCVHQELESVIGLKGWQNQSKAELAVSLASIVVFLSLLSSCFGFSLGQSISDKFAKNSAKYPVDKVKGKSAKYTAYQNKFMNKFIENKVTLMIGIICGFALSRLKL